jgi:hypothetical protein
MKSTLKILVVLGLILATVLTGFAKENPQVVAMASGATVASDLKNTLNEKFILTKFRHVGTWLSEVMSKDKWVNNDTIKIPKRKGDNAPGVLINNTVYPIATAGRDDEHVVVSLNKYDTENREVTDDELNAIAYDKEGDINLELKEELEEKTTDHALHSISPISDSADTPVLETTGADDGTGRKRLTKKDVILLKGKLDKIKVPGKGRIMVLSSYHANDLLLEDSVFEKGYHNRVDGAISTNYYSFKVYEDVYSPTYDDITLVKLAFDSVNAGRTSSIVFHKKSTAKAKGSVKRYYKDSKQDPENRKSIVGYRLYFGCYALKDQGQAAIIDGKVAV